MTIVIGLKCSEGVVVSADGAATLGTMGLHTIMQPVTKLSIIEDKMIFGFSGMMGLSQLFSDRVCSVCNDLQNIGLPEACRKLRDEFLKDAMKAFQTAALARSVVGSIASENVASHTLIALVLQDKPQLIQFDYQCQPEWTTDGLPFVAIGSGEPIADPFLAFIKRVFWPERLPNMAEGRFAVTWTLRHAIDTSPGGISDPIQVDTLEIKEGNVSVRELTKEELKEHEEVITLMENHLRDFPLEQKPKTKLPPPLPPKP